MIFVQLLFKLHRIDGSESKVSAKVRRRSVGMTRGLEIDAH